MGGVILMILLTGSLMIAFGRFTVEDTMPSEDDFNYSDDEVRS